MDLLSADFSRDIELHSIEEEAMLYSKSRPYESRRGCCIGSSVVAQLLISILQAAILVQVRE